MPACCFILELHQGSPNTCWWRGCLATNNKTVTTVPVPVLDIFSDLEIIAIDILNSTLPTRVITCYSPPLTASSQVNFDYMTRLTTCLDILSGVNASIIVLGDFNLPSINWFQPMRSPSVSNPDEVYIEFVERICYRYYSTKSK